tara:strand:- start:1176 stop:2273 length:1098 start_codon:yes stop_codon:yes gene_type:complete
MSELKVDKISTNDGNNVALGNSLKLKSYTTSQKNALTSVAGDMVYDTDLGKPQIYNGTQWNTFGEEDRAIDIDFLVVAGGASGYHSYGGGGGAGGFRASWNNETSGRGASSETAHILAAGQSYEVSVGGGGSGNGGTGNNSSFAGIESTRGGAADSNAGNDGGCGGGGRWASNSGGSGTTGQGYDGGAANGAAANDGLSGGGGGGAGAAGATASAGYGSNGGAGAISSIITTSQATTHSVGEVSGSDVYYSGGGAAGLYRPDPPSTGRKGSGGLGGGGNGGINSAAGNNLSPENGTANTGGGGGGQGNAQSSAGNGGSGVVILKWLTADATLGATRTGLTDTGVQTDGDYSYIVFTAGTGNITFT